MQVSNFNRDFTTGLFKKIDTSNNGVSREELATLKPLDKDNNQHLSLSELSEASSLIGTKGNQEEFQQDSSTLKALVDKTEQLHQKGLISEQERGLLLNENVGTSSQRLLVLERLQASSQVSESEKSNFIEFNQDIDQINLEFSGLSGLKKYSAEAREIVFGAQHVAAAKLQPKAKGLDIEAYSFEKKSPEALAQMFQSAMSKTGDSAYAPADTGCEKFTNKLHSAIRSENTNVRLSPKSSFVSQSPEGTAYRGQSLDYLRTLHQTGQLKPGMVILINSDQEMRLSDRDPQGGSKEFDDSDRHWITYVGMQDGKPMFMDNWSQDKLSTLDTIISQYDQVKTSPFDRRLAQLGLKSTSPKAQIVQAKKQMVGELQQEIKSEYIAQKSTRLDRLILQAGIENPKDPSQKDKIASIQTQLESELREEHRAGLLAKERSFPPEKMSLIQQINDLKKRGSSGEEIQTKLGLTTKELKSLERLDKIFQTALEKKVRQDPALKTHDFSAATLEAYAQRMIHLDKKGDPQGAQKYTQQFAIHDNPGHKRMIHSVIDYYQDNRSEFLRFSEALLGEPQTSPIAGNDSNPAQAQTRPESNQEETELQEYLESNQNTADQSEGICREKEVCE